MTATSVRLDRTSPALLFPLTLIIILLGAGAALTTVAPSRVTTWVYQVIIGSSPGRFTIPTESLQCERTGDRARCTVAVAGSPLVISIQYSGFNSVCRAEHGGRMVPCASGLGDNGQASHTVWISDSLGASEQERARIRDSTPWWRTADGPGLAALALIAVLSLLAGLASALLGRHTTEQPRRVRAGLGIGVLGLVFLAANGGKLGWPLLVAPPALLAAAALGVWQYQLGGLGSRLAKGVGAAIVTAGFTTVAAFVLLERGGFIG